MIKIALIRPRVEIFSGGCIISGHLHFIYKGIGDGEGKRRWDGGFREIYKYILIDEKLDVTTMILILFIYFFNTFQLYKVYFYIKGKCS